MIGTSGIDAFERLTARPRSVLGLGLLLGAVAASGLALLAKDTSMEAFVPPDHSSIQANERMAEVFGLTDSIAVAVMARDDSSVFTPETLELIEALTGEIEGLPNVRADRVVSLASESSIRGEDGAILVDPYVDSGTPDAARAAAAARRWREMAPHQGTLAADDESGAVIMAELIDWHGAADTYARVLEIVADHQRPEVNLLVAGPAAVSGFLSSQIDADARILQPMVVAIVIVFLYLAFLRGQALLGPLLILAGAAGGSLGVMGWLGIPYFAITNALPVIVVAISVADAIHILSAYYRLLARQPGLPRRRAVVLAMAEMVRPITLTTLTTMAGFVGLGATSIMPPIAYFSWFAALGVGLAWVFSIIVLPCALALLQPGPSPAFSTWRAHRPDRLGRAFAGIGLAAAERPGITASLFAGALVAALAGAAQLRVDRSQVENFSPDEPIRQADEQINDSFAGTAFLDVIVDSDSPEGLLAPEALDRVAELQRFFEGLPHVQKTVSIVDYLGLLHAAMADRPMPPRSLPDSADAVAQYLLVYEASGDPTDFEEEISPDYRSALIRGVLNTSLFSDSRPTVEALQHYVDSEFDGTGLRATLAGDVNVAFHWMERLERNHFLGVAISLTLVLAMAIAVFRSTAAGVVAVVPVTFTVLVLYGLMGYLGIFLEPATSMFAAISVGVGVDFAIHMVDRLRLALAEKDGDLRAAIEEAMPGTSRACFFNAAALATGFAVLMLSDLPALQRFGALVSTAALTSFATALVLIPACFALLLRVTNTTHARPRGAFHWILPAALAAGLSGATDHAAADTSSPDRGLDIARHVAERPEGIASHRLITMILTDKRGRTRERQAQVIRLRDDAGRYSRITYLEPKSVREVAFLSHDRAGGADDRWLYLPAARKVRRIPASDRGDYFLGTDFTYDDIQSNLKFDLTEYRFDYHGTSTQNGRLLHLLSGQPANAAIARDLGYSAFRAEIDARSWLPVSIEFTGINGAPLKRVEIDEIRRIEGIWTPLRISARNHRTGHRTDFRYTDVRYSPNLPEHLFRAATLRRGLPRL